RLEMDLEERFSEGQIQLDERHFDAAVANFKRAKEIAQQLPGKHHLVQQVNDKLQLVAQLKLGEELHSLVERLHHLYAAEDMQPQEIQRLAESCSAFWNERERIQNLLEANLGEPDRASLRNDLFEMGLMWADLRVLTAKDRDKGEARRNVLLILDQMEKIFKTSPPLLLLRQRNAEALGLRDQAEVALRAYRQSKPTSAWDHLALGRFYLRPGPEQDLKVAADHFHNAALVQPQNFWANYYEGVCAFRLKRFEDALSSLKICVSLAPDSDDCRTNRDLAQAELDKIKNGLREKLQGNKEGLELLDMLESKKR
ncbi:MAG TPA: hypothetical protein VGZ25_13685, partial [Gemmataceae bacterium]|nr:hypothetical protein [Gemmataceae bacterium]